MKDTSYYISEIKRIQGVKSDYAVAKLLGVSRQMMTNYHNGRSSFDGDIAFLVADLSGHDAAEIVLNCKAAKSKDRTTMIKWRKLARSISGQATAASITLAMVSLPVQELIKSSTLYIM